MPADTDATKTNGDDMGPALQLDDDTAHDRAVDHLCRTLGVEQPPDVVWDEKHHLQGHFDLDGRHMVLIATRRTDHTPLVLSDGDWDAFRRPRCRPRLQRSLG